MSGAGAASLGVRYQPERGREAGFGERTAAKPAATVRRVSDSLFSATLLHSAAFSARASYSRSFGIECAEQYSVYALTAAMEADAEVLRATMAGGSSVHTRGHNVPEPGQNNRQDVQSVYEPLQYPVAANVALRPETGLVWAIGWRSPRCNGS